MKQRWINHWITNQLLSNYISLTDCDIKREYITIINHLYDFKPQKIKESEILNIPQRTQISSVNLNNSS